MLEILLAVLVFSASADDAQAISPPAPPICGGHAAVAVDAAEVKAAAEFAVAQKATGATLVKIVSATQQVVAGMNYGLTLKIRTADGEQTVETVVYRHFKGDMSVSSWKIKPAT
ncbi:MAG: Aspartic acid proteinase inhibitor [Verrucomicrobiota bacterium]|jgi:hypothetical protein